MKYLIIALLLVPLAVSAQDVVEIENPLASNDIVEVIDGIINWIFTILVPIAAIMYIVAGFFFITAAGDPEKVKTAKKMALWVTIGIALAAASKGIINLIELILGIG